MLTLKRVHAYVSEPRGVAIYADATRVTLELGDRLIAEMRLMRADKLAVLDEAFVANIGANGPECHALSLVAAESWARNMRLNLPDGEAKVGDELLAAWREHVTMSRSERVEAERVVEIQPVRRPLVTMGGR